MVPLREPVSFDHPGPLLHGPSGLTFLEAYGQFRRAEAQRFDSAGLDIVVGYNRETPACPVTASFYVYPAPPYETILGTAAANAAMEHYLLQREYARRVAELHRYHQMDSVLESEATTPAVGKPLQGPSLRFIEAASTSILNLFMYRSRWFLEYRFTYPTACGSEAARSIDSLTALLPWAAT